MAAALSFPIRAEPDVVDRVGQIRLLYFAWLRERVGHGAETIDLPPAVTDVAGLIGWLRTRSAGHEAAFATTATVRCAINQEFAQPDSRVRAGDEIAFFPPVTGG